MKIISDILVIYFLSIFYLISERKEALPLQLKHVRLQRHKEYK